MSKVVDLGQYMTPPWAASALVDQFYSSLCSDHLVVEPSCGTGAFLSALPEDVPAVGVEIDPELAAIAVRNTGRRVIVGDFRMVDLPFRPTHIIGNPPFAKRTVEEFLDRAHMILEDEGQVGLILPAYMFQAASTVESLSQHWSIAQHMIPKNLYPRLAHPLCFAQLTKGRKRGLVGFALYHELAAVNRLQRRYKELLAQGMGSVWEAVVRAGLEQLGGKASLEDLYREIEGHRPTSNAFWKPKVRQVVQKVAERVGPGVWQLPAPIALAA